MKLLSWINMSTGHYVSSYCYIPLFDKTRPSGLNTVSRQQSGRIPCGTRLEANRVFLAETVHHGMEPLRLALEVSSPLASRGHWQEQPPAFMHLSDLTALPQQVTKLQRLSTATWCDVEGSDFILKLNVCLLQERKSRTLRGQSLLELWCPSSSASWHILACLLP